MSLSVTDIAISNRAWYVILFQNMFLHSRSKCFFGWFSKLKVDFNIIWNIIPRTTNSNSRGTSGWSSYTTGGKHGIWCTVTSWEYLKFQSRLPKIFGRHLGFWRPSLIFGPKMTCCHYDGSNLFVNQSKPTKITRYVP